MLIGFLVATAILADGGDSASDKHELYSKALIASVLQMEKDWGHTNNGDHDTVRTDYHHVIVKADPSITDGLPTEFEGHHAEYLDTAAQIDRFRKLGKSFAILEIHPAQASGSQLQVTISVSYVNYKHRRLMYGVSDWSDVAFRFDCDKQAFVVDSVKLGGI